MPNRNVMFMRPMAMQVGFETITASSGNPTQRRLFSIQPGDAWKTHDGASLTGVTIELALGPFNAPLPWDGVFWGAHNHYTGFQWRIQRATSAAGLDTATGDDDSGVISGWPPSGRPVMSDYPALVADPDWRPLDSFYRFPTEKVCSHLRLTLNDAGNPNAYMRAGLLRVGKCWQPSRNFSFGWKDVPKHAARTVTNDQGTFLPALGLRWREIHLPMTWLRDDPPAGATDFHDLRELLIWANNARDIVVLLDPDADLDRHLKMICGVPINAVEFVKYMPKTWRADLVIRTIPA